MPNQNQKEIKYLNDAIANGDFSRIIVTVNTKILKGEFGPNLEFVSINWKEMTLEINDSFSQIIIDLGSLTNIQFDEEIECWFYTFYNGIYISLDEW